MNVCITNRLLNIIFLTKKLKQPPYSSNKVNTINQGLTDSISTM